jgi:hypothetical protein
MYKKAFFFYLQYMYCTPLKQFFENIFVGDCSETLLTGEFQFHISTLLGIEPGSLMTGSKRVDHWNCV